MHYYDDLAKTDRFIAQFFETYNYNSDFNRFKKPLSGSD